MSEIKPISQTKLFGLERYLNELIKLENLDKLPNKFLFSGQINFYLLQSLWAFL